MSLPHDIIAVDDIEVDTVIGIYAHERVRRQRLRLAVAVYVSPKVAGAPRLSGSVDYARLTGDLKFILEHAHFELLESALEALATHCLGAPTADTPRAQVERVRLSVEKPYALLGHGVPKLTIERALHGPVAVIHEGVQVIFEGEGCSIYRFVVKPGESAAFITPSDAVMYDLMMGSGLTANGVKLNRGEMHVIDQGLAVEYANVTSTLQTVLRIVQPQQMPPRVGERELKSALRRPPSGRRTYYPVGDE